jgi:branched-chain amino acid transport system ATP-binding protein
MCVSELGPGILLIEPDMRVVMDIAETIAVLDFGCKIAEGMAAEEQADPAVICASLGTESLINPDREALLEYRTSDV